MRKTMISMFAVLAAVSMAKAGEVNVNFDGEKGSAANFTEMLKAADSCQNGQTDCSNPKPVPYIEVGAGAMNTFAVSVGIKNVDNGSVIGNEMQCAASKGQLACRDKATNQLLNRNDIPAVLVEEWWARRSAPGFVATRSPYTTCSSGHEFYCEDYCRHWAAASSDVNQSIGTSGASSGVTIHTECTDWSYKCSDQGAGTCSGATTPPSHGFHHPDEKSVETVSAVKKTFDVSVGIKNAKSGDVSGKDMVCSPFDGRLSCSDKATGQLINNDNVPAVLVREWWTRRVAPGFTVTKSPYTTCSSGHAFDCEDYCRKWVETANNDGYSLGDGVNYDHGSHSECAAWSYQCTDQGAGTCAGPTNPPQGGFHHPDEK